MCNNLPHKDIKATFLYCLTLTKKSNWRYLLNTYTAQKISSSFSRRPAKSDQKRQKVLKYIKWIFDLWIQYIRLAVIYWEAVFMLQYVHLQTSVAEILYTNILTKDHLGWARDLSPITIASIGFQCNYSTWWYLGSMLPSTPFPVCVCARTHWVAASLSSDTQPSGMCS